MYFVIDLYEWLEVVGVFDYLAEAEKAAKQRIEDTDGECHVDIYSTAKHFERKCLERWGLI